MVNLKKSKIFITLTSAACVLATVSPLAMAQEGELKTTYSNTYATDPTSLDYLFSFRSTNNDHTVNFIDGLYENDPSGEYVPAVAESHEVSEDGLVYTYHLRKGVKWVDMNGNEMGDTTAHDFVAGLKHAADSQSEMLPIVQDSIKGLNEYISGEITDFAEVGVKAIDDYTLEYTLTKPEPFFNSKTTYGIMYPVNQSFLDSMGENFGSLSPDSILYNGPFMLRNYTAKSKIEYAKNENYWDAKNVFVDSVSFTYNDGSDIESFFRLFKDDAIDAFAVNPNEPIYEEIKKAYEQAITLQEPNGTTFNVQFNLNRSKKDKTAKTSDAEFESTQKAIHNKKFRQALLFGLDRSAYMKQTRGEDFKNAPVRNILVPPTFVKIKGQPFGDSVAKYLEEMNPELYGGLKLDDSQDAYFNSEKGKKLLEEAKAELEGQGVTFPIHLDLPVQDQNVRRLNEAKSLKASIEENLGAENVVIDLNLLPEDGYLAATYNATIGEEADYDITTASGWGPDYLDPSTYLDIYGAYKGSMLISLGLNPMEPDATDDPTAQLRQDLGLVEYQKLLDEAEAITEDLDARYEAYAKAQAFLQDLAIALPMHNQKSNVRVTRVVPFSTPFAYAGPHDSRYKYMKVQKEPVTKEQYAKALEVWKSQAAEVSMKSESGAAGSGSSDETAAGSEAAQESAPAESAQ